ncbi:hypothetical protein L218DRAFT_1075024 [Marasmius fiardii PR-910]|nr:hypothetical protein L218DRAFT_1075024 [Marasmius fiardii PR-910]
MHTNPDFRDPSHRTLHYMHRVRSNLTFGPDGQVAFIAVGPEVSLVSSAAPNATLISSISLVSSSLGDSSSSSSVSLSTSTSLAASLASSRSPSMPTSSALFTPSTIPQAVSSPLSSFISVSTVTSSPTSAGFLPVSVAVVINNPSTNPQPSATTSTTTSSATSITHSPAFYIGILLGTVVMIASVATVIAWWIRVRQRNTRHHKDLPVRVPWARSSTISSGFVEIVHPVNGHASTNDLEKGKIEDAMVLRRGESEKLKLHLELMGDRDVGMPKRTQSYMEELTSPIKRRRLPILKVPSPPPVPVQSTVGVNRSWSLSPPNDPLPESVAYPLPEVGGRRSLPPPPSPSYQPEYASTSKYSYRSSSHSISDPFHPHPEHRMLPQSAYQHQQQFPTGFGTPREAVVEPRYLSVLDKERRLDSLPEQNKISSHCLSDSYLGTAADGLPGGEVEPATVSSESWTTSIRNRMMNVLGISFSEESHACERYTDLPFLTPARARRVSLRKAGWVQYTDGEIARQPSERERAVSRHSCQEPLRNPFDDESMGLGIDIPSHPSPSSTLPPSHPYITRNGSHPHFNPTSACSIGPSPFDYAPSVHSYGSAAPLILKKHLTVKNGGSRPVSRASSRYSTISRTGSVMTVLTEKEEAAGRALRERWARGGPRRPSRM